jgi:hypothetical protein
VPLERARGRIADRVEVAHRDLARQVPVDRATAGGGGEHLLQLVQELLHLLRVVRVRWLAAG